MASGLKPIAWESWTYSPMTDSHEPNRSYQWKINLPSRKKNLKSFKSPTSLNHSHKTAQRTLFKANIQSTCITSVFLGFYFRFKYHLTTFHLEREWKNDGKHLSFTWSPLIQYPFKFRKKKGRPDAVIAKISMPHIVPINQNQLIPFSSHTPCIRGL